MTQRPLGDPSEDAQGVAEAAKAGRFGLKLLGGAGIHLSSPSARKLPLKRGYGDLDFAMSKLRAQVGVRVRWYELPEQVRSP